MWKRLIDNEPSWLFDCHRMSTLKQRMRLQIDWRQNITFHIIMLFRKPCHMPFRKLIPPFTITALCLRSRSFVRSLLTSGKRHPSWELNLRKRVVENRNKNALYLSVNVFSTKVLIGVTIFTSPTGGGTAIFRGHPSHAKVQPPALQREYLHFSVILRPWVMVRPG